MPTCPPPPAGASISRQPMIPPAAIAATWPGAEGTSSATSAPATAMLARGGSGQRLRAMPHTACATTATATIISPCSQAAWRRSPTASTP